MSTIKGWLFASNQSTLFRRQVFDPRHMGCNIFAGEGRIYPHAARRMIYQPQVLFWPPRNLRPDRAWHKIAATSGANIVQHVINAIRAIGAFIAAHACLRALWRQVFVAEFAVRSELKSGH